jgi:hypothetical protein
MWAGRVDEGEEEFTRKFAILHAGDEVETLVPSRGEVTDKSEAARH